MGYIMAMKTRTPPVDEATRTDAGTEPGHADWKRAKVQRAIAEAKDRDAMIPAEQVWRDLGLER